MVKKRASALLPIVVLVAACGGTATTPAVSATAARAAATASPAPLTAKAELRDKDGATVATATFSEDGTGGVKLALNATKLPAGQHGWHIHATGNCTAPDFMSAGAHFNPDSHQHGAQNPQGPHAGDLGNLTVTSDGTLKTEVTSKAVTLESGKANSLFKDGGTALVIHANVDDEKTDPSGNTGARIACGVVQK